MDPIETTISPAKESPNDREIIREVLGGHTQSYEALIRRYQDRIFGFCMTTLSNREEAEEAAQEVFVKAFRSLARFRGDAAFSTWLIRIAVNECRDALRRRSRRRELSLEELQDKYGEQARTLFLDPAGEADSEMADLVDQLLSSLRPEERTLLVLREREGHSYTEIAAILGCSVDAVKARLRRARQSLREMARHFSP
ncbi:MAG: RNA polymerase sigma factor [Nitrospirae bacterium]|nr:RNA polymerase sigma factor [Nitrospirota bacterium]